MLILNRLSKKAHILLSENNLTLSVAESCTGGLLSRLMTMHAGSSRFFDAGLVTYSNQAKMDLLQIPQKILDKYGAVSKETAILLADNIKKNRKTNISLSITGIAGPSSDASNKSVGLVFIVINNQYDKTLVEKYQFCGSRRKIQKQSCTKALQLLINQF